MDSFKRLLLIFAIVYCVIISGDSSFVYAQSDNEQALIRTAEKISFDTFKFKTKTRKGVRIFCITKPKKEMLQAIDKGLSDLFVLAKKYNYKRFRKHSDYVVFIATPDTLDDGKGNYLPAIAVPLAQYKGSIYDQGGFLYAAGMVIGYNPGAFLMADHVKNFDLAANIVRFEGEHILLYHNDQKRYQETADHSKGGGHPILQ